MNIYGNDTGIIQVSFQDLASQRLPRIIEIKHKLDHGDILNEFDIECISEALHDARSLFPYLDRHPEYEMLASKVIHFYKEITDEALVNQKMSKHRIR